MANSDPSFADAATVHSEPAEDIGASLQKFLRGVAHNKPDVAAVGYRELLTFGSAVIPLIEQRIKSLDWSAVSNHLQTEYLTAMLGVVEEINPARCAELVGWLRSQSCHARVAVVIAKFEKRADAHHDEIEACGLQIVISREIERPDKVADILKKWLRVPPDGDLAGISRIDVVPKEDELDYSGYYSMYCSAIRLTWEKRWRNWHRRPFVLFVTEKTLYHEIGHHALKHTIGGQDEDQEKEADSYSHRQLDKSHPRIVKIVKALAVVLRPLVRLTLQTRREIEPPK